MDVDEPVENVPAMPDSFEECNAKDS